MKKSKVKGPCKHALYTLVLIPSIQLVEPLDLMKATPNVRTALYKGHFTESQMDALIIVQVNS